MASHTSSSDELKIPAFLRKKKLKKARPKPKKQSKKGKLAKKPAKKKAPKRKPTPKPKIKKAKPLKKQKAKARPKLKKAPQKQEPQRVIIGITTHYFDKIKVVIILIKIPVSKGQTLEFEGLNNFKQKINSMQFNRKEVETAKKGQEIGMKVKKPLKVGDIVYLVK